MKLPIAFPSFLFLAALTATSPVAEPRNRHQILSSKKNMDGHLAAFQYRSEHFEFR